MARRNRRKRANERRRKMKTHESEPERGSDEQSELYARYSYTSSDTHLYEVHAPQPQNMHNKIEIKVERPISNSSANAQHLIVDRKSINTLHLAALKGDWEAAESTVRDKNIAWKNKLTEEGNTALHIAVSAKQTDFVCNLVKCLEQSELELKNKYGYTAFCTAAVSGVVKIAEVMYDKNKNLPVVRSESERDPYRSRLGTSPHSRYSANRKTETENGYTPLKIAICYRNTEMAEYLYTITPLQDLEDEEYMDILAEAILADMYDFASKMLNERKEIAASTTISTESALQALAQKHLSYNQRFEGRIWERLVSIIATIPCLPYFKRMHSSLQTRRQAKLDNESVMGGWKQMLMTFLQSSILNIRETQILHVAAKIGNVEFLTLISQSFPEITRNRDSEKHSIFHVAVINRQEKVFSLIYQTGADKDLITYYGDDNKNNILHLAGKLAPPSRLNIVSGPALQMQRELQWFKAVEKIIRPSYLQMENEKGETPRELFTREHETLRKDGEKWMKNTATSCMVVATLIATVVFAAAFTVPGGYKEKGAPIFLNDGWFTVFVTSDAVAMFSSTASILTFLSLFTAQYEEDDFLFSLPAKLMVGLVTLFASILCMVITFSATFFLVYKEEKHGTLPKLVAALGLLPIALYAVLNFRLWIALIHSTFFASRFMFRPGKHRLF